ncbi:predicted protein [Uncinocarpus reesii 1704]|uniref:Uncharacterized protein n=1 Tax=Uncinocarpus reesii (strain UAMH 1704) TaxID=336963 RepID=C4JPS1_UNCRE|nr:uncharacterized protein UREG_04564 [Uncinocarpus reesii 1704]EEP79718.1 predicted protein [Uncinocarpus reesii 1704]
MATLISRLSTTPVELTLWDILCLIGVAFSLEIAFILIKRMDTWLNEPAVASPAAAVPVPVTVASGAMNNTACSCFSCPRHSAILASYFANS